MSSGHNASVGELATKPLKAMVDSGFGTHLASRGGAERRRHHSARKSILARGAQEKVEREVGYAILDTKATKPTMRVVFAESGDIALLGVGDFWRALA